MVKRRASIAATTIATASAMSADDREQARDVRDRLAPGRCTGCERHLHDIGRRRRAGLHDHGCARRAVLAPLAGLLRRRLSSGAERAVDGRYERRSGEDPDPVADIGLGKAVGDDPLLAVARQLEDGRTGSTSPTRVTTGRPARTELGALRDEDHVLGHTTGAGGEIVVLLLVEVRPEPVDDQEPDEPERHRHDGDEGERQPALEGPAVARRVGQPSTLGKRVPDATDRLDEGRMGRVVLELVAQVADVDVDRLLVLVERLVVAQQVEQLGAGVDAARLAGEVAEDLELGRGEADPPVAALDAPPVEVDEQVLVADDAAARPRRRGRRTRGAAAP